MLFPGIANTLSLTDKLFSKVRALEAPPVQIHFAAYSKVRKESLPNREIYQIGANCEHSEPAFGRDKVLVQR